jgi:hypothetical protein
MRSFKDMYVCMCVCMYKGWAIKSSPCTATFNDLLCFPSFKDKSFMMIQFGYFSNDRFHCQNPSSAQLLTGIESEILWNINQQTTVTNINKEIGAELVNLDFLLHRVLILHVLLLLLLLFLWSTYYVSIDHVFVRVVRYNLTVSHI